MTPTERRTAADIILVQRHRRFVASEECRGVTTIVLRVLGGEGETEAIGPLPSVLAWATAATSLQADDLLVSARRACSFTDEEDMI